MAFAALHKQRVVCEWESGAMDIVTELAPGLTDDTWQMWPFQGRIVACRLDGAVWRPASRVTCTHFVAAKPLQKPMDIQGFGVVAHMGRLGYATIMTQAQGDCGIESLLVLADARRSQKERSAMRRRLQAFLRDYAGDPVWHAAFWAAGELLPAPASAVVEQDKRQRQTSKPSAKPAIVDEKSNAIGQHVDPPKENHASIVMCDETNLPLRTAILWSAGVTEPTDVFF